MIKWSDVYDPCINNINDQNNPKDSREEMEGNYYNMPLLQTLTKAGGYANKYIMKIQEVFKIFF